MAADEDDAAVAFFIVAPFPLMIAIQDHVHALEHEALGIILEIENALAAQNVLAFGRDQILHPREKFVWIERLSRFDRD